MLEWGRRLTDYDEEYEMKIIDTLPAPKRKEIQTLGTQVNAAFLSANSLAEKAVAQYLEVGRLLTQARVYFEGDNEFGKWRKENTTISASWANKLMRAHGVYLDGPPAGLGISALAEIAGASPELKESIEERAADSDTKTPSVRDIRQEVKEEQPEPKAMQERKAAEKSAELSPTEKAQIGIELSVALRMSAWEKSNKSMEEAFILLGLPPFFDGRPNMESICSLSYAVTQTLNHPVVKIIEEELYSE